MNIEIVNCIEDPLDVAVERGVSVAFSEPSVDEDKQCWKTVIKFIGSHRSRDHEFYGESALQSLRLATEFVSKTYERHIQRK